MIFIDIIIIITTTTNNNNKYICMFIIYVNQLYSAVKRFLPLPAFLFIFLHICHT